MDSRAVETLFLICNRASVSEALGNIPADELPTYDELKNFNISVPVEIDLAWSDVFPQLAAWLAKRDRDRKDRIRNQHNDAPSWRDSLSFNRNG